MVRFALSLILSLFLLGGAHAQTIKVMTSADLSPLAIGAEASPRGFYHDLLDEVGARAGLSIDLTYQPWDRAQKTAMASQDHYIAALTQTDARRPHYRWIAPMITIHRVFVSRDQRVDDMQTAEGLGLVVGRSVYFGRLERLGWSNIQETSVESGLRMVQAGRADAMFIPAERAVYVWRDLGFADEDLIIGETISEAVLWLAGPLNGDPEIEERLTAAMESVRADGVYDELYRRYFGRD
ncbi:MAG: transporter substrate-binding domain-containing protein [Pseudomonadota bacterium]